MAALPIKKRKKRKPDRKRATATVSVTWGLYDRLDTLAAKENAPIASVIEGLLDHFQEKETEK